MAPQNKYKSGLSILEHRNCHIKKGNDKEGIQGSLQSKPMSNHDRTGLWYENYVFRS